MKILTIILTLLIPHIAIARMGETIEQCNNRYGMPVMVDDHVRYYEKEDVKIRLRIGNGKVQCIRYFRDVPRWKSSSRLLTEEFVWELIKRNFQSLADKDINTLRGKKNYERSAFFQELGYDVVFMSADNYTGFEGYLFISNKEFSEHFQENSQNQERLAAKKRAAGF